MAGAGRPRAADGARRDHQVGHRPGQVLGPEAVEHPVRHRRPRQARLGRGRPGRHQDPRGRLPGRRRREGAAVLGRDHALTGAVAFAALVPLLHVTAIGAVTGTVLTAGAALLPDIDEPGSTIAREGGFLTTGLAWVV